VADLELELRSSDAQGVVVTISGEIDMATAPQLRELLNQLVDDGSMTILLDCRDLAFLDSSGIGVLVAVRNRIGDRGTLTLEAPQPHVRKVLELTGVGEHVVIVP
jgi:anti-sigma B factor antagonist